MTEAAVDAVYHLAAEVGVQLIVDQPLQSLGGYDRFPLTPYVWRPRTAVAAVG